MKVRSKVRAGYCTDTENDDVRPAAPAPAPLSLLRR